MERRGGGGGGGVSVEGWGKGGRSRDGRWGGATEWLLDQWETCLLTWNDEGAGGGGNRKEEGHLYYSLVCHFEISGWRHSTERNLPGERNL